MIKFRGLAIADYKGTKNFKPRLVYGNVWRNEEGDYVIIGEFKDKDGLAKNYVVDPQSVAMFCGYDKNGAEIYSSDYVETAVGGAVMPFAYIKISVADIGKTFENIRLVN